MLKHTSVYTKHFNIGQEEHHYCEICGLKATGGIHHLSRRGMGGSKDKDYIENLMALCKEHHQACEDHIPLNKLAKIIHENFIFLNPYQNEEFNEKIFLQSKTKFNALWSQIKNM